MAPFRSVLREWMAQSCREMLASIHTSHTCFVGAGVGGPREMRKLDELLTA